MIYYSDQYELIKDLEITGYLSYYDNSYGTNRCKDVVRFTISKQDFDSTDFERVNIKSLFENRLKPKMSAGLYKKPSIELKSI